MMVEQTVYEYLVRQLSVPVYVMQPDNAPEKYVLIERTGGGVTDKVPAATIAVQSYGGTLYDAAMLNEEVKAAMDGLAQLPGIGRCHLDNDYNFTDTTRKRPRYQAVFDIRYY